MTLGFGFAFAAMAHAAAAKADDDAKKLKIVPEYEQRERFERRTNKAFNEVKDDNRSDLYTRLRPGFKFSYGPDVSGEVIYQYAQDTWWQKTGNNSTDNSDLLIGYAKFKTDDGDWSVGRERLKKGNERLLGESGWNNISNSFDVVRFQGGPLDVFGGKIGVYQNNSQAARILGSSYDTGFGETLFLITHDDTKDISTDDYTLDQLYKATKGNLHGEFEGAYQMGRKNTTLYRAWALSGRLTETLTRRWNVSFESNAGSGGTERNGTDTSLNNLYPTNHFFYGNEDLQGWANMGEIDLETSYKVDPKVKLTVEAHHFWLHDASDAWYGNSGAANKYGSTTYINPTGSFGKDIGEEFSLDCQWDINKKTQFLTGVADFQPGRFVESFVTTGFAVQQLWAYAQFNIKF
jgi:hypothetical protein